MAQKLPRGSDRGVIYVGEVVRAAGLLLLHQDLPREEASSQSGSISAGGAGRPRASAQSDWTTEEEERNVDVNLRGRRRGGHKQRRHERSVKGCQDVAWPPLAQNSLH
jgi:hypothetical protein